LSLVVGMQRDFVSLCVRIAVGTSDRIIVAHILS
jgi:hypothetical protein